MYFDYAATTPVLEEIKDKAADLLNKFENPSSVHVNSMTLKKELFEVRKSVADFLNTTPEHIFFTSGATEANNTVIKGYYYKNRGVKQHYFTSQLEHPSVLAPIDYLNKNDDFSYDQIALKSIVDLYDFEKQVLIKHPTFCSLMLANNETGTIFPIKNISDILTKHGTYFHVDATQAVGKLKIDVQELDVDALSFSGHKIFAPKGIGVLYLKNPDAIDPLLHGGGQEFGMRCGTENVFSILALKFAIDYFKENFTKLNAHYRLCRTHFLQLLDRKNIPYTLNESFGLVNILSIRFAMKGDALADILNFKYKTMISVGSACSENKEEKNLSYVLKNMGLADEEIQKTARISFGLNTTLEEVEELVKNIEDVLAVYH